MEPSIEERLKSISWADYHTAYGPAVDTPNQLLRLAGADRKAALDATHELWCGLCHQHVQVGTAAGPALPILLDVLNTADRELTVELLDILLGFAIGSNRQRTIEFQRSSGQVDIEPEAQWLADLRHALLAEMPRFEQLASAMDEEIAGFAKLIIEELNAIPDV